MAKRVFIENNYLVIAENTDITDDKRNLISNVYVEINGSIYFFYRLSDNKLIETLDFADILDADGVAYLSSTIFMNVIVSKTGKSTFTDVVVQSSTSPLLIVKASNLIAETTLAAPVAINDEIITVTSAAGFVVGQYLTIYNAVANRVYFGNILVINGLNISLDTFLDFAFPSGSFISVGNTNMAVDGSVTFKKFGIRNPSGTDIPLKYDISRLIFTCLTSTSVDLSKFGDIVGGLVKGVVVRKTDGEFRNIFNAKTNAELKNLMYDFDIQTVSGNQQDGFTGRITFAGENKMGSVIRLSEDEDLEILIQDDLSTLVSFTMISQGSEVTE